MSAIDKTYKISEIKKLQSKLLKNQTRFIETIDKFDWHISACMQGLNLCRQTYYDWLVKYPAFKTVHDYYKAKYQDDILQHELQNKAKMKLSASNALTKILKSIETKADNDTEINKSEATILIFAGKTLNDMTEKTKTEHSGGLNNTQHVVFDMGDDD